VIRLEGIKKALVTAIEKAVKNPELKAKVDKMGFVVNYKSPAELNRLKKEQYEIAKKWVCGNNEGR
jgi:tripartite-type tricarboxylate transporter receptor subunit TctC